MKNRFDIAENVALVTGSGQGIGFAIARGFGLAGAIVVLNGRHPDSLEKSVESLRREGIKASGSVFDVTDQILYVDGGILAAV